MYIYIYIYIHHVKISKNNRPNHTKLVVFQTTFTLPFDCATQIVHRISARTQFDVLFG
jgi:hypothetical protein